MIGETLGHYKIVSKLGEGGMGEVFVAEDPKLKRNVALKILPPEMAKDPDRRARFKREAQAVAALNHPNIVHIYSVEEANGYHFLTMELVEGQTLSELLPRDGFKLTNTEGKSVDEHCLVKPLPGIMVMFPGWLVHQVHPFHGDGERISIAFNILSPRGSSTSAVP